MFAKLAGVKRAIIRTVWKDTINRDILTLLIVSVIIGSLLASSVSYAANGFFDKTLSSLVGDYGEYDVAIQLREALKDEGLAQIEKIVNEVYPGGRIKAGPTLSGQTAVFIALPEQYKTKAIFEELRTVFSNVPGSAGTGIMTEPRLTIRAVPDGAKDMLIEKINQMGGVRFAFRDGGSIGVILTSIDKSSAVNEQIKQLLQQYQVIDIAFLAGNEPPNPIKLGDAIASDMQNDMKLEYAKNVSVDGKSDDMTYMVSTMMELKRFLAAYASQVTILPEGGAKLLKGDVVVFQGTAQVPPVAGKAPEKGNVVVEITGVKADGAAEGRITQGDASLLTDKHGYKLENNVIGPYIGTASYRSPRQDLGNALGETAKLVGQIPGFAADAQKMSSIAAGALDNYSSSLNAIEKTLAGVQQAGTAIQAASSGLSGLNTGALQVQLDNSARAMGALANTLQIVKALQPDAAAGLDGVIAAQQNLVALKSGLLALDNIAGDARKARIAIDTIVADGNNTIATLRAFDVAGTRNTLAETNGRLAEVQKLNIPMVTAQLQYLGAAVPNLKDEEISHSINILDKFIAGQVIPAARIQILTTRHVTADMVTPVISRHAGHSNFSVYNTDLGIIEPDPRGEIYSVLQQVKGILAGMVSIVATILFLVLDHTAIMTAIRRRRLGVKVKTKGWRGVAARVAATYTAPERQYGMAVGAALLTAMFVISGGGIPYLPWIGVPVLGALLGLIVANNTEKISPVSGEEVMAGEALGLSFDEIMREIVIPSGRPGLMQKLNSRKVKFK